MRINDFQLSPIGEFRYLNAGRGAGRYYEDGIPVHVATVDKLPEGLDALVLTADLQGRERFEDAPEKQPRLIGEVITEWLARDVLPNQGIHNPDRVAAMLAGDFYTVPALDKRGGTGDVSQVWQAFANEFAWVAGVPGNHDTFGDSSKQRPRCSGRSHFLDGDLAEVDGFRIGGLGGIIGNPKRPNRRYEDDYLNALMKLADSQPQMLLMHDGPAGSERGQRGWSCVSELLVASDFRGLVVRGHAHWKDPFAEFECGLQVLNVDARLVVCVE